MGLARDANSQPSSETDGTINYGSEAGQSVFDTLGDLMHFAVWRHRLVIHMYNGEVNPKYF